MPEDLSTSDQRVLVLAPTGRDAILTENLLHQASIPVRICPDMATACDHLQRGAGAIVLAEEALDPNAANMLLQTLDAQPPWSDPPLVLLTGRGSVEATQRTLAGLGDRTNLTLLERPVRSVTLVSAVQSALRARRRQYQVRDLLVRLEQGVQERDRFLAILSHELRNPLATILGALAVHEQDGNSADADPEQQIIARQTRHLARLIDDLLDVSRVSAGKIVLQRKPVDLKDIAHRSLQSLNASASEQRHEITITTCPEPTFVLADPTRLEQIATNLLANAIKYTPPGGHIALTIRTRDKHALLSVSDDGVGIAPEVLPTLFKPFVQVDRSLDRAQGGLGLGLSLVRNLAEMHGGTVAATSPGLSRGSTFTVRLPLITPPAHAPENQPNHRPQRSRRVLLVEDAPDVRTVMQRLLRLWGHEVTVAENGDQGVAKATSLHPEVALVDLGLPGLDGYEVARQIRAQLGSTIYLIALTGYGQPEDRQRTRSAGFDLHLVKPVEPAILQQTLCQLPAAE
jgi:signal transduction histidine kinase